MNNVASRFWRRISPATASAALALSLVPALHAQDAAQPSTNVSSTPPTTGKAVSTTIYVPVGPTPNPTATTASSTVPVSAAATEPLKATSAKTEGSPSGPVHLPGLDRPELQASNDFLRNHPLMAEDLAKNPTLLSNKEFVESHPQLKEFYETHAGVLKEIETNPAAFMKDEKDWEAQRVGERVASTKSFANYLTQHPDVAKQLRKDPSLGSNPAYLAAHPELKLYLEDHLGVREELRNNPEELFQREGKYVESTRNVATLEPISLPLATVHGPAGRTPIMFGTIRGARP
jgi:hypothetical protein